MMTLFLALRNLFLQRKRYLLVAVAIAAGFALVTFQSGTAYGAMETVMVKAARYFSGHVSISGYRKKENAIENPEAIINAVKSAGLPVRTVSKRTIYAGKEARLFFGGNSVRLRRQVGFDFEGESGELARLPFTEGGIEGMAGSEGHNGIIISRAAARLLGAHLGDDVSFYLTADNGQHNTATMIVRGIFDETSIFGYATYMRNDDLNALLQRPEGAATEIAVYAREGVNIVKFAEKIRTLLDSEHSVFPPILRRDDFPSKRNRNTENETFAVMSLDAHLDQIKNLLDAFLAGSYFIFVVFMLIVMIGVLNTYRVMVYERTREIGTMRAIGMQRGQVKALFLYEATGLVTLSSATGFVIGILLLYAAGTVDLSGITASALFTESGRLKFYLSPGIIFTNFLIMAFTVLLAAWGPADRAGKMPPAEALGKNG